MFNKLLSIALLLLVTTASYSQSAYVTVELPKGVSIDIPKNWVALSNSDKIDLSAFSEAIAEEVAVLSSELGNLYFAANYYNKQGKTEALVNLTYYPNSELSQEDVKNMSEFILSIIDIQLKDDMNTVLDKIGFKVIEWKGLRKEKVGKGNLIALITEYRRSGYFGDSSRVKIIKTHNKENTFNMTVSYTDNKPHSFMLEAITNKIINSLRVKGL